MVALVLTLLLAFTSIANAEALKLGECPKTKIIGPANDCLKCHTAPSFKLREPDPAEQYETPTSALTLEIQNGIPVRALWILKNIDGDQAERVFKYLRKHKIRYLTIEIHSPGGSLFDAWRVVGFMNEYQSEGAIIETKTYGVAASAGFLILISGTKGYRSAAPTAHLMWHELLSFALFKIETPTSSEEGSRILRKFQNLANQWISDRACIDKEKIDQAVKNKDFWISGKEALEYCFVDKIIGGL